MLLQRLFLLVGFTALPFIGLIAYDGFDEYRQRRAEINETLLAQTRAAVGEYDRLLTGARYLMFTLAHLPALRSLDIKTCNDVFSRIGSQFRTYGAVAAFDRNERLLCSSLPAEEIARIAAPSFVREALHSDRFTVGVLTQDRQRDRRHLPLAMPFTGADDATSGVILLTVDLTTVIERIAATGPGSGMAILVADRQGTILLAQPVWTGWADQPLPAALIGRLSASEEGVVEAADPDGEGRLWAYLARDELPEGLFVATGKLKTIAFSVVDEAILRSLIGSLVVIMLALGLAAWGASRFIHRPVTALIEGIEIWRPGDAPARLPTFYRRSELARIAVAFTALEERCNALFAHRELLMKELQHRVLNTMQILSSVLGLQAHRSRTPETRAALEEAQQRIRAVAAVYHRIYELERAQSVDLAKFLHALTRDLGEAYGTEHLAGGRIAVEAESCHATPANTISLAMVITELVANAVKYAGRAERPPEVAIRCSRRRDGNWVIEVADNGPGLSAGAERQGSLGVTLVNRLVTQLGGMVDFINTQEGLSVRIILPATFADSDEAVRQDGLLHHGTQAIA